MLRKKQFLRMLVLRIYSVFTHVGNLFTQVTQTRNIFTRVTQARKAQHGLRRIFAEFTQGYEGCVKKNYVYAVYAGLRREQFADVGPAFHVR
jgi:hypothetical protein